LKKKADMAFYQGNSRDAAKAMQLQKRRIQQQEDMKKNRRRK